MGCFIPKILFWVNFGGNILWPSWYILMPIGKFNDHLVHFVAIWYIFSPVLVYCTKEQSGNPGRDDDSSKKGCELSDAKKSFFFLANISRRRKLT
jgi:hypothetical protein